MSFRVRFTEDAREDFQRLYDWLLQQADGDFTVAERALQAIGDGVTVLELAPLSCRKACVENPFLRELVIGFGASGYVAQAFAYDYVGKEGCGSGAVTSNVVGLNSGFLSQLSQKRCEHNAAHCSEDYSGNYPV